MTIVYDVGADCATLGLLPIRIFLSTICCFGLENQSEIDTESGHASSFNSRSRSLAHMQTRKAFRSETSISLARRRGLTSKHVNTLTESDLMKAVMSFTEQVLLTLSTHRTVFFTNLFAADMFLSGRFTH